MKTPVEKVSLAFKCPIALENISNSGGNNHCNICNKNLIDFRNREYQDIIETINPNSCGIFNKHQTLPKAKNNFFKRMAAMVLITLGLTSTGEHLLAQTGTLPSDKTDTEVELDDTYTLGYILETLPVYKNGGDRGLYRFLSKNLKHPSDGLQGTVYVKFTVDTTGFVLEPKVIRGLSPAANEEALRVVRMLEFIPGTQRGKKVRVVYNLPIKFNS